METVLTVKKETVTKLKSVLYQLMSAAKDINIDSTLDTIRKTQDTLHIAKGIYKAMQELDVLNEFSVTDEDLNRIEQKQLYILDEKHRHRRWKH